MPRFPFRISAATIALAVSPLPKAYASTPAPMTDLAQARRVFSKVGLEGFVIPVINTNSRYDIKSINFTLDGQNVLVDIYNQNQGLIHCELSLHSPHPHRQFSLSRVGGVDKFHNYYLVLLRDRMCGNVEIWGFVDNNTAETFSSALQALYNAPAEQLAAIIQSDSTEFERIAAAYRSSNPKPALPDSAKAAIVQAEDAIHQSHPRDALAAYRRALEVAPWWPGAHFNIATLSADQLDYVTAIIEMRKYLTLAPDAPDAAESKNSIWLWQGRINNSGK